MLFSRNQSFTVFVDEEVLGRELLDSEKCEVYRFMENFRKTLNINTQLCNEEDKQVGDSMVEALLSCFPQDTKVYVKRIPNEYCNDYCCVNRPWLKVTTHKGVIKIGWRKRVIVIDWSESDIVHISGTSLFKDENVTSWDKGIHAWGYEKAKEYLKRLLDV